MANGAAELSGDADAAGDAGERRGDMDLAALDGASESLRITETATEIRLELAGDILFDFDKADIRFDAVPVLRQVSGILKQFPQSTALIAGHTDAKGSDSYNLRLSERRAASVKDWLVAYGEVDGSKLATRGYGKAIPVAPNTHPDGSDNPEGRQRNRRVEIAIEK